MKKIGFLLFIILFGCTEPYHLQTSNFEEALVIEATLSNELNFETVPLIYCRRELIGLLYIFFYVFNGIMKFVKKVYWKIIIL